MVAKGATILGGPETAHAFDQLAKDVADMTDAHARIATARLGGIARLTPVRSGALRASWSALGDPSGGSILSDQPYAWPVESGVAERNILPVGMIARTLEADQAAIVAEYEQAIRERGKARGFPVD